jgi:protein SCO1/2
MIRNVRRLLAALVMALAFAGATAKDLPGDSVYLVDDALSDQAGRSFTLAEGRGKPRLVAMFYTSCRYICPLIVDSAKGIEQALTPAERQRLGILLVSLDPARDDTAALASVAAKRKLDPARWTLARTEAAGVRRIAAVLGVRYRALADGEFNHTSSLVLLDAEGRVVASTERLGAVPDPAFLTKVKALVAGPAPPPAG